MAESETKRLKRWRGGVLQFLGELGVAFTFYKA